MKICKKCVLPDTRPNLEFSKDGVCGACKNWDAKLNIDWKKREKLFKKLARDIKKKTKDNWDCIIPVSGGKDSTWQVIKALNYGLKPLCITWKTPARNKLGQKNLENIINLGVDHIDVTIDPKVEKYFSLKTLKKFGSTAIPMHLALFAIPINFAVKLNIKLIIWGENSAIEYGGEKEKFDNHTLNSKWLKKYGVSNGTVVSDWQDNFLTKKRLNMYQIPNDDFLKKKKIKAIFLGYFFKWDPYETYKVAKANGFKALGKPKIGKYNFADIDDDFLIVIHHWMKIKKFGFSRLWDNLSLDVRLGKISKQKALKIIENDNQEDPIDAIKKYCSWVKIDLKKFYEICNKHYNKKIWKKKNRKWTLIKIKNAS